MNDAHGAPALVHGAEGREGRGVVTSEGDDARDGVSGRIRLAAGDDLMPLRVSACRVWAVESLEPV